MESAIVARGCFIVGIKISNDNEIVLTIESERGTVTLDDCVELSRVFEEKFSRDTEDYGLTVTSAGLDQPFTVLKQYLKAVGTMVEVQMKTNATTMAEFKANRRAGAPAAAENEAPTKKEIKTTQLAIENPGWYRGTITFKRVIQIPGTMKFQYQDTRFSAYVKAMSGQDCYNRIVHHLKNRQDVDLRSQFPSARGINFSFNYMGAELPPELLQANA